MHSELTKILKNLYRAQFMAIDAYQKLSEDKEITEGEREQVKAMLADHEMHRDRLKKVLEDAEIDLPNTTAKIAAWGGDVLEFFEDKGENYMKMQSHLNVERTLIDVYDVAAVFAQDDEELLSIIDTNADEDVTHAEFFKEGALGYAEDLYESK